jgi:hypothetical protein
MFSLFSSPKLDPVEVAASNLAKKQIRDDLGFFLQYVNLSFTAEDQATLADADKSALKLNSAILLGLGKIRPKIPESDLKVLSDTLTTVRMEARAYANKKMKKLIKQSDEDVKANAMASASALQDRLDSLMKKGGRKTRKRKNNKRRKTYRK